MNSIKNKTYNKTYNNNKKLIKPLVISIIICIITYIIYKTYRNNENFENIVYYDENNKIIFRES